jgi:hypothetical protein
MTGRGLKFLWNRAFIVVTEEVDDGREFFPK